MKIIKTCNLYLCFIVLGMCVAVPGPTLLDLQHLVHTDTKNIAFIYTARSIGYLVGSLGGGVLFDLLTRKQFVLTLFNLATAVTMLGIPWCRSIVALTAFMVGNGASLGVLDTGGNVCCLNLWGKDSGPYYQALHFAFGVGGLIAPLIAAPFLGSYSLGPVDLGGNNNSSNNNLFFINSTQSLNSNFLNGTFSSVFSKIPTVTYAYTIIGGIALLVTVLFLLVCIVDPVDANEQRTEEGQLRNRSVTFTFTIVFLTLILMFVETGTEIGYAQMLTSYAVKSSLRLSETVGSYMTSTFWAAFTISRFVSVFLAIKLSSLTLIFADIIITSVGSLILVFLGASEEWALWLATVLLGIGIASFFPAAVGWVEQYLTVTNKMAATFTVGAAFGEMVIPYTISYYIDEIPEVLLYIVPVSTVLSAIVVFIMYLILRKTQSKYVKDEGTVNPVCTSTVDS
ncbi:hypothetical protein JTE90_028255 [Oedothorax gibbosus]|uniref:Sodium-dependent glucose transporter 1 n=1 Tax=Oedothorax gibbosus TaxID=931172 RepID=A0AAV6URY6_9ARAC|nr:hypothetical protein JTE90_028255 [Oedothorax gibbosus]